MALPVFRKAYFMKSKQLNPIKESLLQKYSFRYNILTKRTEFAEIGSTNFRNLNDYDLNGIFTDLIEEGLKCSKSELHNIINSKFSVIYNPIDDYFEGLPSSEGKPDNVKKLCDCVKLADESERDYFLETFRVFMRAVVACAYDSKPNHSCLTFVGKQGIFKTTFLNNLCPQSLRDKYLHSGSIGSDKDSLIRLNSCFLINNDEFATLNNTKVDTFKTILSQSEIQIRIPYGRLPETLNRRASFVGSLNKTNFLSDHTGNRRFLVFEIENIDMEAAKKVDIDLVYSQALFEYKSGLKYFFNQADNKIIQQKNQRFEVFSKIEELLLERFKLPGKNDNVEELSSTEVAKEIFSADKHVPSEAEIRQVGSYLQKHNFKQTSKRIKGRTKRVYSIARIKP